MWLAVLGGGAAALLDWFAVGRDWPRGEQVAKPAVVLILALAVATQGPGTVASWSVVVALLLSLLGDVLLLPAIDDFVGGLAAFLVAHVVFVVAFLAAGPSLGLLVVGAAVGLAAIVGVGRTVVRGATLVDERLGRAVVVYILALAVLIAFGVATGSWLALLGVILFAVSDAVLGWNRFVTPLPHGRLFTHVPYHLAVGLLALWAIRL